MQKLFLFDFFDDRNLVVTHSHFIKISVTSNCCSRVPEYFLFYVFLADRNGVCCHIFSFFFSSKCILNWCLRSMFVCGVCIKKRDIIREKEHHSTYDMNFTLFCVVFLMFFLSFLLLHFILYICRFKIYICDYIQVSLFAPHLFNMIIMYTQCILHAANALWNISYEATFFLVTKKLDKQKT